MKKLLIISLLVYSLFLIQLILVNIFGPMFIPNLLLILVMFIVLFFGIRYGIITAVLAGLFVDSFSTNIIGINIISFIVCAYLTTILQKYIYRRGSPLTRLLLVFCIITINMFIHVILYVILGVIEIKQTLLYIYLPEVTTTVLIANWLFHKLKQCALRLSV